MNEVAKVQVVLLLVLFLVGIIIYFFYKDHIEWEKGLENGKDASKKN